MSETSNTILFERASDCIDYFEGSLVAELIERDIDNLDLESLAIHVNQAEAEIAIQELHA